jgi:diaminopimelate epimerase
VATSAAGWSIRTYERGVEEETLACGTGAVATAALLTRWGLASSPVALRTRSGGRLEVRFRQDGTEVVPSLRGEGRLVYEGRLRDLETT